MASMAIVHRIEAAAVAARKLVARRVAAPQRHRSTCSQQHASVGAGSNAVAYRSSWFGRRPWMELQPQAGRFVRVDDSHAVDKPRSAGMRGARADELAERPDRHRLSPGMKSLCCPLQELFGELGLIAHASIQCSMYSSQQDHATSARYAPYISDQPTSTPLPS